MEKLIELLNEYNKNNYNKSDLYYLFEIENWMLFCYDDATDVQRTMQDEAMVICSKEYWFIKWLVNNDKIDFSNLLIAEQTCWTDLFYSFSKDEVLLMLLSIQDEPISFLISILK